MLFFLKRKKVVSVAKKFLSIIIMATIVTSMITLPILAEDKLLVNEDFKSYSPGDIIPGKNNNWVIRGTVPTMTIVNDKVNGRNYATLKSSSTSPSYIGRTFGNQVGAVTFDFDINIPGSNGGLLFIGSGSVDSTSTSAVQLQFDAGKLQMNKSIVNADYDITHWYHYKISFNILQKKFTITIMDLKTNETVAAVEDSFINTGISNISSFGFSLKDGGTLNIDNFSIKKIEIQMDRLSIDGGNLENAFEYYCTRYNLDVPTSSKILKFTPKSKDSSVMFSVGGKDVENGGTATIEVTDSLTNIPITVKSTVYEGLSKTYTFNLSRLDSHLNLENLESEGRDTKVLIGWSEPKDPNYVKANIYQVKPFTKALKLIDTVPKGKYIATISNLKNKSKYNFIVKAVYADNVESSGVTVSATPVAFAARQMENLNRGIVAIKQDSGIYVGWRLLGTDPEETAFNLYRDGAKVNSTPIVDSTNYLDSNGTVNSTYYVRPVLNGKEQLQSESVKVWNTNYLNIPLQKPKDGVITVTGETYTYAANEASVADLDGDGQYEIVMKWTPSNWKDNAQDGYTGPTYLDAYELDGTRLWRIDCGINIRSGSHYNHFIVYDLDGDGKAEVALKTADGTVDGLGTVIGDGSKDYRNSTGYILEGPEYLTVFRGTDGKALSTTNFIPERGNVADWGDAKGNRVDRFLACVAYLDGVHPSLVMTRGYYTRMTLTAYDFKDGAIKQRWAFDTNAPENKSYASQGNHQLSVADVDADGKDEIVTGAACIDDNGKGLWNSHLGHGDALHVGDLDPNNLGLEVWSPQEDGEVQYSCDLKDARTGRLIFGQISTQTDTGRALTGDIDPRYDGEEMWAPDESIQNPQKVQGAQNGRLYTATGEVLSYNYAPSMSFAVWWDGDLSRELLHHDYNSAIGTGIAHVDKWDYLNNKQDTLVRFDGMVNNGSKGYPMIQADLFGDWREEIMMKSLDDTYLRIYSTTDITKERIYTLMQDPEYRLSVAWQNVAYNQPPHPSFYLGNGMDVVSKPNIYMAGSYTKSIASMMKIGPYSMLGLIAIMIIGYSFYYKNRFKKINRKNRGESNL